MLLFWEAIEMYQKLGKELKVFVSSSMDQNMNRTDFKYEKDRTFIKIALLMAVLKFVPAEALRGDSNKYVREKILIPCPQPQEAQ